LRQLWGFRAVKLVYVAVGGGSHHWRAEAAGGARLWLNVDDLDDKPFLASTRADAFAALRTALETARRLHDEADLEFVLAPMSEVARLTDRYALAVYPFLDGTSAAFGERLPDAQQQQLLRVLIRLHEATPIVADVANVAQVGAGERAALEVALDEACVPWTGGPFAEDARGLIAPHIARFRELLASFDALAVRTRGPRVITHGEPHPANLLTTPDGALRLLDWDTVGLAPAERDLWWLDAAWHAEYARATGRPVEAEWVALYRLRWFLDDLASSLKRLRAPATPPIDAERAWAWLQGALAKG
jgi:spectinomycin phosphotransferase